MLSKRAKYALHALVFLSREKQAGRGPAVIGRIAEQKRIPRKFLEAILLDLRNAGILGSKKGRGGGYYLRSEPAEVTLADVIRHFDGALALLPCATYRYYERCEECPDEDACALRDVVLQVRDETVRLLKANTLQDLLNREAARPG